jgi:AAA domain-containing protein
VKAKSLYPTVRGRSKPGAGLVVIVRGPIGSGKTTLLRGLDGRRPWRFWCVDADVALSAHPGDPWGEFVRQETSLDIDILGLHAKLVLGRGLNVLLEQNFQTQAQIDRFLRWIGRSRRDSRVVMLRLTVNTEEAVRRKTTVEPSYVRASHKGFILHPIPGELVIETSGKTARQVLRSVRAVLVNRPKRGAI